MTPLFLGMAATEDHRGSLAALRLAVWQALPSAGLSQLTDLAMDDLILLPDQGLAHDHIRLGNTGMLARLPKQSQWQNSPQANLCYQRACFEACAVSGTTPQLFGVLPVSAALPFGALLVEFIPGRRAALPDDLPAIAACLARLHASDLAEPASSLSDQSALLEANRAEIDAQMAYLDRSHLAGEAKAALLELRRRLETSMPQGMAQGRDAPRQLIANDTHPGNYVMRGQEAVLVDLEKAALGNPGIDLAHASAYTSTTWEPQGAAVLALAEVREFYAQYLALVGDEQAKRLVPWLMPARRLLYMRALSWCLMWLCELENQGSGWSQKRSEGATVAHFQARARHFLQPGTLSVIIEELAGLDESLCP